MISKLGRYKKLFLVIGAAGIAVTGIRSPMVLIYLPVFVVALFYDPLTGFSRRYNPVVVFMVAGVVLGLLTEVCAILENMDKPPGEKILLCSNPVKDLIYSFFYYLFVMTALAASVQLYHVNRKVIFILMGIYGICVEQSGAILVNIFRQPFSGVAMALLIAGVYGTFPTLALSLSFFKKKRRQFGFVGFVFSGCMLFLQWAVYGNVMLPFLNKTVGR